jgi:hypothetical protein
MNPSVRAASARRLKEECVLVDHRTYRFRPGTLPAHVDLYHKNGFVPQTRHLGHPVAWLTAESGELNTVVHIWAYEDAADRARRRAAMQADPEWQAYLKKSAEAGFLVDQRTSLMIPAGFAPIKR